ncbi:MAG: hypothetical protein Q9226_000470 [Calogaya cf. arnoldii]
MLYHDRTERQQKFLLHVQILRVNKQINAEATSILYQQNAFLFDLSSPVVRQCTGGVFADHDGDPPYLFRADSYNPKRCFRQPGVIYPHCMQRLANIEIIVSVRSIWGSTWAGEFFTHIGELLLELLRLLALDGTTQKSHTQKRLVFTVRKSYDSRWGGDALFLRKKNRSQFSSENIDTTKTGEQLLLGVGTLLKTLCENRKVSIKEIKECTSIEFEDKADGERCEKRTVKMKQRWVPMDELRTL